MANEKRAEQRYMVNWPMQVCRGNRGWTNCKTVDISATGVLFVSADRYRAEELVLMEVAIRPTVLVQGVARIVREIGDSGRCFRYAAEFRDFSADGRRLLKDTLNAIRRRCLTDTPSDEPLPATSRLATVKLAESTAPATESRLSRGPVVIRRGR